MSGAQNEKSLAMQAQGDKWDSEGIYGQQEVNMQRG
jgi:hypothetical protein